MDIRLGERNEGILEFIVRDYVRTATPVSSGRIAEKKSSLGSSATIRNAMAELAEAGLLYQPHTSAGRAPTDKGYRYFVQNLMEIKYPDDKVQERMDQILAKTESYMDAMFRDLSDELAADLKLFSGVGFLDEGEVFGRGLSRVLREPEFEERNMAAQFAYFTENLINEFENLNVSVKMPVCGIDDFGSVSILARGKDCGEVVIFSAGPKRMDYERAASLLKYAADKII